MSAPLHGIRVLDLSRVLAGPWATQLLGDFGADVVKLERPGSGDETRQWGPPWIDDDPDQESAYFLSTNRNKRSITVDLSAAGGRQLVRQLAGEADVVVENFKDGTMQKFGLDPDALLAANPRLVCCRISAYASGTSRAREPGYDAMIQASAGLMSITGPPAKEGGGPQKVGVAVADIMTGMYAATAILAALNARNKSGQGQCIEVPLYDSQVAMLANQNMNYLVGGTTPQRRGTAHPNIVPYQAFRTLDGHLMLAVGNDHQFLACCDAIGRDDLGIDPRFKRNQDRVRNREFLVAELEKAFAGKDTKYWLKLLKDAAVPAGPVNDLDAVFADDYARERQLVRYLVHPQAKALPSVANPVTFSKSEVSYRQSPPMLGQHTAEVLQEWLKYDTAEIDRLAADGII